MPAVSPALPGGTNGLSRAEAALRYANAGLPVFPVHSVRDGVCSCGKGDCEHPGKHPRTVHGFKDATTDPAQVARWWKRSPDSNIGMPTGPVSGLLVVDIDPRNGGDDSWSELIAGHDRLPVTAEQITGGGGRHIFYRDPGVKVPKELAPGIDLKSAGGYVVVAPSVHLSGRNYAWDGVEGPDALLSVAAPPPWLLAAIESKSRPRSAASKEPETKWGQGRRNTKLTSIAGTMRRRGMSLEAIEAALLLENRQQCLPPLDDAEVRRIAQNVASYPPGGKRAGESTESVVAAQTYQIRPEGMFRVTTKGEQQSEFQLSNFRASIVSSRVLDDGVETGREFQVEAELLGRSNQFSISARNFTAMNWPIECVGAGAIVFPNQREYLRTAVQMFAGIIPEHRIYTHTGWRHLDGDWVYLHAAGAIGATGIVEGVDVSLPVALQRLKLERASDSEEVRVAVRASLKLLQLAPPEIGFPLRAATCRAILGGADFGVHLAGETGAFKSEMGALEQQHFGAGMDSRHLPGSWLSTANALEVLAFHSKDAVFVIDDFAPQGNTADIGRYHASADRVFRAAGNQAGRSRLNSEARLQDQKAPRALILSTGEDIPRGHSIRARLLILELSKGMIDPAELTTRQQEASSGLYAKATAAFVEWLAGRLDEVLAVIKRRVFDLRVQAYGGGHARTPEIIANCQAGLEVYLEFAESCGALTNQERQQLADQSWVVLRAVGTSQVRYQAAADPAARFMALLQGGIASGRVHLASRKGTTPERSPEACGWRLDDMGRFQPQGERVGWVDGEDIYLQPTAVYGAIQVLARESGEPLPVSDHVLRKRLREKGLLASWDTKRGTLTVRRTIVGSSKDVMHFHRATLLPEDPDKSDNDEIGAVQVGRPASGVGFSGEEIDHPGIDPDKDHLNADKRLDDDCRKSRVRLEGEAPTDVEALEAFEAVPAERTASSGTNANLTAESDNDVETFGI